MTSNGAEREGECPSTPLMLMSEHKKLPLQRSALICSSGKDKYTFDSERAPLPRRPSLSKHTPTQDETVCRAAVVRRLHVPRAERVQGRFQSPWQTWHAPSFGSILKLGLSRVDRSLAKHELPLHEPSLDAHNDEQRAADGIVVTWLGHSSLLVSLDGVTLLTDPVFSDRASPSQVVGPKRVRGPPCSVHELPPLDAVVISHAHYDHLDLNSVLALNARFGGDLRWFVPIGLAAWMSRAGVTNVVELDWWEENCVQDKHDVSFTFTPTQHWSKRTLTDDNRSLWGSWTIVGPNHRFFFAGDSGYCDVFALIGQLYGPFDCAAIPIGHYEPRTLMQHQHVEPSEAVQVHDDLRARFSVAIHWGTFPMSAEPLLEPPEKLRSALRSARVDARAFATFQHGETRLVRRDGQTTCLSRLKKRT